MDLAIIVAVLVDIHGERRIGAGSNDLRIGPCGYSKFVLPG